MTDSTELPTGVLETLVDLGLDPEGSAGTRVGHATVSAGTLEPLVRALPPLPVGDGAEADADVRIVGRLGQGGMGVVELAHQRILDREVALKRVGDGGAGSGPQALSLLDEARVSGRLDHPNVVPVHAVGHDEKLGPVVLFKRVQGEVWSEVLAADRAKLPRDAKCLDRHLRVLVQVCNALRYAHSKGYIHRDVKPENVMLGSFGEVYLLDWGLALDVSEERPEKGALSGTPAYMAPEMALGQLGVLGPPTDVYLLGATLCEILTGEPPHKRATLGAALMSTIAGGELEYAPEVPAELAAIARRAMAYGPEARFGDAGSFQDALLSYFDQREARALVDAAAASLDRIAALDSTAGDGTESAVLQHAEITRHFQEARFALDRAALVLPEYPRTRSERKRALLLGIRHALAQDDVRQAMALAEELGEPLPRDMERLLTARRAALKRRRERISALEREHDLAVGHDLRHRAAVSVLVLTTGLHILRFVLTPGPGYDLDPRGMVVTALVATTLVLGATFALRGRFAVNTHGRQFERVLVTIGVVMVATRGLGVALGHSPPTILTHETLLFACLLLAVETPLKVSFALGLFGVFAGVLGVVRPDLARYLYVGFTELVMVVAYLDLRRERRELARGRPSAVPVLPDDDPA